jgi:hypothetical protein
MQMKKVYGYTNQYTDDVFRSFLDTQPLRKQIEHRDISDFVSILTMLHVNKVEDADIYVLFTEFITFDMRTDI